MTNAQVEDVLSSIRRLVSEERSAEPRQTALDRLEQNRLVLTPAQRVETGEDLELVSESDLPSPPDEALGDPVEASDEDSTDEEQARLPENFEWHGRDDSEEATEPETLEVQIPEPETAEVMPFDAEGLADDVAAAVEEPDPGVEVEVEEPAAAEESALPDPEPEAENPQEAPRATADMTLGEKIATLEALVARQAEDFEPDDPELEAAPYATDPADGQSDPEGDVLKPSDTHQVDSSETQTKVTETMSTPAEEEPVWARVQHAYQSSVFLRDSMPVAEAVTEVEADATGEPTSVEPESTSVIADEDILDEAALRELVADIVREELQGALGERITRNVRKLVRREIHRALAAQDLG